MRVEAGNVWARVTGYTTAELTWLDEYLTIPERGADAEEGPGGGAVHMLDVGEMRFPSGLVRLVGSAARREGMEFDLMDVRAHPLPVKSGGGAWLRDYQVPPFMEALARRRGVISMPTGGGKNAIMAAVVQAVPVPWLILVDTKDLMHQGAEAISGFTGEEVGECGDGVWRPRRVTVATVQSLYRGIGADGRVDALISQARGLLCDEVQVLSARESNRVAMAAENAYWRLGVSATPLEREDEADYLAVGALGPLIHDTPVKQLIDGGWLARPEIAMVEYQHEKMTGSWPVVYEAGVTLCEGRNEMLREIICSEAVCPRPTLVFFKALAHGRRLLRAVEPTVPVEMVDGGDHSIRRKRSRVRLEVGLTDVLLTSRIFNKGIDIPGVLSGVNAAAGRSLIDAVQKPGRGLRIPKGSAKKAFKYWDVMDRGSRALEEHANRRLEAYRGRGYDVRIVTRSEVVSILEHGG